MRLDPRLDSGDRWMDPPVLNAGSILQKRRGEVFTWMVAGLVVGAYLFLPEPWWWSAHSYALYTLHNDVYRRTDGNNRLESKYLTLFRAMFRLAKSAAYSGGRVGRKQSDEAAPPRTEKWRVAAAAAENWIWNKIGGERSFVTLSGKKQRSDGWGERGIGQGSERRERKRFPPISILSSALNVIRETWNMSFWTENR